MLGFFNRTHSELDGTWEIYEILYHIEVFAIILSLISISFWFSIIVTAKSIHRNVRIINAFYYGQYLIQLSFWAIQPLFILFRTLDDTDKFSDDLFTLCSYVRICGMFWAFATLPALVIERSFATFLVEDYERKANSIIGNSTVVIQLVLAIGIGVYFNQASNTVGVTVGAIIANFLAFLLNNLNERVNSKYYYELDRVTYSLSERFQITENIRAAQMFNKVVWSIGFFNIIVNACLIIDNYDTPINIQNLTSVSCDFSILMYGFIVPVVYYRQTDSWRKRVATIFSGCCSAKVEPLKDTFGHDMASQPAVEETSRYFEMLANQWK